MAVTVRKAGVYKPTVQPYVKKTGVQKSAKKTYIKNAGVWKETWPLLPNPPQNVHIATPQVGEIIVIDATWTAPAAGASAATSYRVRAVFTNANGTESPTGWIEKAIGTTSHRFTNDNLGWQHRAGQKVRAEAWSMIAATTTMFERQSDKASSEIDTTSSLPPPVVTVPPVAAPAAPTSFTNTVSECEMTQTWAHVGGAALDKFEIWTWLNANSASPTKYTVGETLRKWTTYPWDAATTVGATVHTQIRAVGQGGASAWVTYSATMPGPVTLSDYGFKNGNLQCTVDNMDVGVGVYSQKYGGGPVLVTNAAGNAGKLTYTYPSSSGFARDNVTRYRLGFTPRNAVNAWTGRTQWTAWAIKIPNPVYIAPADCNTWWSIPIPGKWRTNPQAENWFYQGKSISGNSYGTLFFQNRVPDYFDVDRIGYSIAITSWDVYTKRTNTGGLVAAVALNVWTHARDNDIYDAAPGLVNGPAAGPSLLRDQKAWVPLSTSWWANMLSGKAKGVTYYVDPSASDNQLRSEIGNVSNRYMILDKPEYGSTLDGQKPGTLRIFHDG